MHNTLFDIIDAADAAGYATFTFSKQYADCVFRDLPKDKKAALRRMLESLFHCEPLLTLKLDRLKRWVDDIEASSTTDEAGNVHLRVNLARMLLLPCEQPAAELAELRQLFERMKPFFETNASRRSDVQFCNERDRRRAVYGRISCRVEGEKGMETDEQHTKVLQDQVAASPVLQAFLRNVALALQKIGPWSWLCIDEDQLYGRHAGPWSQAYFAARQAKRSA